MSLFVSPFIYPKSKHSRKHSPKQYKRYQTFKKWLRSEFNGTCVYCHMPWSMKGIEAFAVEHYKPKSLFPALAVDYSNLFFACNTCNSFKGSYWPSGPLQLSRKFIPNPCDHEMFKHLRFNSEVVEAKSDAGRTALLLLDLNSATSVAYRKLIIDAIETYLEKRKLILEKKSALKDKCLAGEVSQADADAAALEFDGYIAEIDSLLNIYTGAVP